MMALEAAGLREWANRRFGREAALGMKGALFRSDAPSPSRRRRIDWSSKMKRPFLEESCGDSCIPLANAGRQTA
jgi:hypothetical protein